MIYIGAFFFLSLNSFVVINKVKLNIIREFINKTPSYRNIYYRYIFYYYT